MTFIAGGNCTVLGNMVHLTGAGSCTITASQAGNDNYNPAGDVAQSFNIGKATSTTTVTCSPAPFVYTGLAITPYSANVTGAGGLNLGLTVSYANNVIAGTATASAAYAGDDNHFGSNDAKYFTIVAGASTTVATSSKNPSAFGDSVSFTATITPSAATGSVQFKIDGVNFGLPVAISGGSATSGSTSSLTLGNHNVTAVYSGDNNFTGSQGSLTQLVASPVKINGGGKLSQVIHFGFNVKPVQDDTSAKGFKGHVEFHDNGVTGTTDDLKFKSTSITSEYAVDNSHGTLTGAGTLNGVSGYTFIVDVEDNAKKGAGHDKFRIRIYGANNALVYDSSTKATNADGTLTGGKVKIHYDKDDFTATTLEGIGTFLSGGYNFDIDVQGDGAGGYDAGAGIQFTQGTDPNYTYTLTSDTVTNMKIGGNVTVNGTCMINGVTGYTFQLDWDPGKKTLHLRTFDPAGKQIYDSKPNPLTTGNVTFTLSP